MSETIWTTYSFITTLQLKIKDRGKTMNIMLCVLLSAFNGPQQIIIYDIEKDDVVYDGFISDCPSYLKLRDVKSIDPLDADGPRAGIITFNI